MLPKMGLNASMKILKFSIFIHVFESIKVNWPTSNFPKLATEPNLYHFWGLSNRRKGLIWSFSRDNYGTIMIQLWYTMGFWGYHIFRRIHMVGKLHHGTVTLAHGSRFRLSDEQQVILMACPGKLVIYIDSYRWFTWFTSWVKMIFQFANWQSPGIWNSPSNMGLWTRKTVIFLYDYHGDFMGSKQPNILLEIGFCKWIWLCWCDAMDVEWYTYL